MQFALFRFTSIAPFFPPPDLLVASRPTGLPRALSFQSMSGWCWLMEKGDRKTGLR